MPKQRDLTEQQFKAKLKQYGFSEPTGQFCLVTLPNSTTLVSLVSARSDRYRDMLAYLLKESAREQKRQTGKDSE
jgi:hypothetical protein